MQRIIEMQYENVMHCFRHRDQIQGSKNKRTCIEMTFGTYSTV